MTVSFTVLKCSVVSQHSVNSVVSVDLRLTEKDCTARNCTALLELNLHKVSSFMSCQY